MSAKTALELFMAVHYNDQDPVAAKGQTFQGLTLNLLCKAIQSPIALRRDTERKWTIVNDGRTSNISC